MIKNIKFCSNLLVTRNFRTSSLCCAWNWKDKVRPPNISEEESPDADRFLKFFTSRKGISADVLRSVQTRMSMEEIFSVEGFKQNWKDRKYRSELIDQRFINERVDTLGPDLAAAHFVIHRGGKIRFKGFTDWMERDDDHMYDDLPTKYNPDYLVEGIDISKMPIMYDGLQNFENLHFLKSFIASQCPKFNDWCMDRISCQFADTLEELDISSCPLITGRGLEPVAKFRKLKVLKIHGLENLSNHKLLCLLLEECSPQLQIEGMAY